VLLNTTQLEVGCGCDSATAAVWLPFMQAACDKFAINTPRRVASFLSNVGVESGGFKTLVENLNYSAQGLANTWWSRYAVDPNAKPRVPNGLAVSLAHNPQAIANDVYANRLGNGAPSTGDGWAFRGQGPIQITGRTRFVSCMMAIDLDTIVHPEILQQPEAGALSAAWYFLDSGCNAAADRGDIAGVVKLINGQEPNAANQGQLRIDRYTAVLLI
jgi:putative chitinase